MKGSVYKKDGCKTYTVSWYTNEFVNGSRKRKSKSGFKTKREADKYLRKMLDEVEEGFQREKSDVSLNVFLPSWLDNYSVTTDMAQNTIDGYNVNIQNHILPCIGSVKLDRLEPEDIDRLILNMVKKGLSVTSQRYVLATLRRALNYAVKRRIIAFNPINCVDLPKPKKYVPVVLNKEQIQKLHTACISDFEYLPILVIYSLGLRRGEALGLQWSDFDFEYKTVFVQRTATPSKGGYQFSPCKTQNSIRKLYLPEYLVSVLLSWKEVQNPASDSDFVFAKADGKLIPAMTINRRLKRLLSDCGLPDIRVHDLRHSWATLMLSEGINPKIASSMLGHSNISITLDTYSHMLTVTPKQSLVGQY